jgi:putative PIN family toxin of toxin-antitoxin system
MKVVIDTNVLVSALLKDRDPEAVVLRVVQDPEIEWVVSDQILNEYRDVIRRPRFRLSNEAIDQWLEQIKRATSLVVGVGAVEFPRDPKDAPLVACALAAQADFLVSGDWDLRDAKAVGSTLIVSVADFKLHLSALDRFRAVRDD